MLSGQIAASFILWIGAGVCVWRTAPFRGLFEGWSRNRRIGLGTLLLVGSVGFLFAMILGLQSIDAIQGGSLTIGGWAAATLGGAIFVALQVLSAAALLGAAMQGETSMARPTSDSEEGKKES